MDLRKSLKRGFSLFLTVALAVGLMPVTGITAGADTMKSAGGGFIRIATATASEAEKAGTAGEIGTVGAAETVEEEPLDEDKLLLDGDIWDDTPSDATPSDVKREKYPIVYAYYEKTSQERRQFRAYVKHLQQGDRLLYSFVTFEEWADAYKNGKSESVVRDIIVENKSRTREYDTKERPAVFVPDYLKEAGLENVPVLIYFWVENEDDDKLKDIYAEENERLASLTYSFIMPRVIASFEDGSEAWSGSVDKGTKIYLKVGETPYDQFDYEIQYTLNGAYPGERKDSGVFPMDLFGKDEDVRDYKPGEPIVINEDTIIRAAVYPVQNGDALKLPDGYSSWIVGTWSFRVFTGKEDLYEPDNTLAEAFPVEFPTQITATVHDAKDEDFYSFTNGNYASVRLTLTPAPYCAYGLRLMNEQGDILKECALKPAQAGQMGYSQTIVYSGAAGKGLTKDQKFIVQVYPLNGTFDETLSYTLRIVPTTLSSSEDLPDDPDFSELDMVLSYYGLEKGDQTDYTGRDGREIGSGTGLEALNYLSQWYGPVDEKLEPYPKEAISGKSVPASYAYRDHSSSVKYHLQNMILGVSPEEGREAYLNSIKNMVYTYGGCAVTYEASDEAESIPFIDENSGAMYSRGAFVFDPRDADRMGTGSGHAVEVIGWYDELPKELFGHSIGVPDEEPFGIPEHDGGLLIKNSWGTDDYGMDGFFWLSYDSIGLLQSVTALKQGACAYLMEKAGQYDRQYLNDATGAEELIFGEAAGRHLIYGIGSVEAGNVFTADDNDQLLTAVSLVAADPGVNYDIWLTYNGETTKILSGCEQNAGYYTKQLSDPVLLKAGSTFTLTEVLYADGGKEVAFPYGYGSKAQGLAFRVDRENAALEDMSKKGEYPCLRAFTVIPDYDGAPKRICQTSENLIYGQTAARDKGFAISEYAAEAIKENSLENTLTSSAVDETAMVSDLPYYYDARREGLVTTVKNQGKYGSCWAFGAIAAVESNVLLNGGTRMEYPRTITVSSPDETVTLTKDAPEYVVTGKAELDAKNAYDGTIFWTYSGDTDSIEILTTSSCAGQEVELFRFKKPGKVTARAASGADISLYSDLHFTAVAHGIESITLDSSEYEMKVGEELQLEPKITPEDVWDDTILYTSSNPAVAYVDKNGKITALKAGTVTITLRGGDQILEITVTVTGSRKRHSSGSSGSGSSGSYTGSRTAKNQWVLTGGKWYHYDALGSRQTGWLLDQGKWYYLAPGTGEMRTGWLLDQGKWYYLAPGNGDMQTGLITESGYQYYLSPADGHMLTGTVQIPGAAAGSVEIMRFNETPPPAPTYTLDPLSGIWKRNEVDALPYGARVE